MDSKRFNEIGTEMFGERFGKQLSEATGINAATISAYKNGRAVISVDHAQRINDAYLAHRAQGSSPMDLALKLVTKDRKTGKFVEMQDFDGTQITAALGITVTPDEAADELLSDSDILNRINKRVRVMDTVADGVIHGHIPSMIAYGAPGVGKSYTIMQALEQEKRWNETFYYDVIKGAASPGGLYKALWYARKGGIVVLDDVDSIFDDEDALNLLKAALDSSDERVISWRKQSSWLKVLREEIRDEVLRAEGITPGSEEAEDFDFSDYDLEDPESFNFSGGVIFITNVNMKEKILKGSRMAPHFEALISRSLYVDLTMDTDRAKALRVRQVFIDGGMARKLGLSEDDAWTIVDYIMDNKTKLQEVSLRMAKMISTVYLANSQDWQEIIEITKFK